MEIEEEYSIEKAVSDVKKAKNYLLQEYSNKHCFEPIKDFIKEVLAREVEEIVKFFESSGQKLYLSENKNHNVQTFSKIVKNHVLINEQRQERISLPSPIQQDIIMFENFFNTPCCKKLKCTSKINIQEAMNVFKNFITLSEAEQDFFIYGQLQSFARLPKSKMMSTQFVFDFKIANQVCCQTFYRFVHGNHSTQWLNARINNFKAQKFEIVESRGGAHNVIPFDERLKIHAMIGNYLETIVLDDPSKGFTLVPSSFTFDKLYSAYTENGGNRSRAAIYAHYKQFWPDIRKIPSYSDYCSFCFVKRKSIKAAINESEKEELQEVLQHHLERAASAREYYKVINIGKSKLTEPKDFLCISIDWAQNWEIPRYNKQPGEIFFMSRQKIGLFGITDERTDIQTFYCVPEKELNLGKGPNITLSYLYHYLMSLSTIPKKLVIYADNCVSQNKNNYLLWFLHYLSYVLKIFTEIELNFLIPGHTKFSCDRHFGYAKKALNTSDNIETFRDAIIVIKESAINQRVLPVRDFDSNTLNVLIYDWKTALSHLYRKAALRFKLFESQYFRFQSEKNTIEYRSNHDCEPMFVKLYKQGIETEIQITQISIKDVGESRIEDLKKVEKFINPQKLQEFWKGVL